MWSGVALAAFSAACFATKGVFAKLLYADGWSFEAVIFARAVFSLPIIAVWAFWRVGARRLFGAPRPAILGAAAAGLLCYYAGVVADFYALTLIGVGIERVLVFSYPSMVVLLYSMIYRTVPGARVLVALAVTFAGIVMVVTGLDLDVLKGNLAGAGFVLFTALTFAIYFLASDRWTGTLGSIGFTLYAAAAATAGMAVHVALRQPRFILPTDRRDAMLIVGLVLVATVLPMLSMAEGVRRLGAERASVVSTIGPPTTILLGAWFLHERLIAAQWAGVALIGTGILILELLRRPAPMETGIE